jgi:ribosomal-protein-alanine N-acetyltransferase
MPKRLRSTSQSALAIGPRVYIRHPTPSDRSVFCAAVRASRKIHASWARAPEQGEGFAAYLSRNRDRTFCGMLVCRREDGALAGVFNLSQIFRGNMQSAYLGYYALAPFAGYGYMTEGLELVLRYAFTSLRLHRIEANIQPQNLRSIALARRCGFRYEGLSPRYLKVAGRWRDHERWAILVEDWRRRRREPRSS